MPAFRRPARILCFFGMALGMSLSIAKSGRASGLAATGNPRIGIVIVVYPRAPQADVMEAVFNGFKDSLMEAIKDHGYEPVLLYSNDIPDPKLAGNAAAKRRAIGEEVFTAAKQQGLAAVWEFCLGSYSA
jgi:hypothetical protein